ncbi:MAG: hypothetical protein ACJAYE_003635 [Candidatus Azotimanducaceae bacterium]|jgi:hypothetical protein
MLYAGHRTKSTLPSDGRRVVQAFLHSGYYRRGTVFHLFLYRMMQGQGEKNEAILFSQKG